MSSQQEPADLDSLRAISSSETSVDIEALLDILPFMGGNLSSGSAVGSERNRSTALEKEVLSSASLNQTLGAESYLLLGFWRGF